jgi:hypothetical protein
MLSFSLTTFHKLLNEFMFKLSSYQNLTWLCYVKGNDIRITYTLKAAVGVDSNKNNGNIFVHIIWRTVQAFHSYQITFHPAEVCKWLNLNFQLFSMIVDQFTVFFLKYTPCGRRSFRRFVETYYSEVFPSLTLILLHDSETQKETSNSTEFLLKLSHKFHEKLSTILNKSLNCKSTRLYTLTLHMTITLTLIIMRILCLQYLPKYTKTLF